MITQWSGCLLWLWWILLLALPVSAADQKYHYDANGNLISGDGKYFEYNDANKLVRVRHLEINGPILAEYVYDHSGQRIKKIEVGITTYYIGKHFEKQAGQADSKETKYYFANAARVAKKDKDGSLFFYHSDHLGSTNAITDTSGNLIERSRYYPYGDIRSGGAEQYTYTGKEKDNKTGFYYYEARHYDSGFRHFTQPDWVNVNMYDPQNLNRYSYVRNNPLIYFDPSGNYRIKDSYNNVSDGLKEGFKKTISYVKNIEDKGTKYTREKINSGKSYAKAKTEQTKIYVHKKSEKVKSVAKEKRQVLEKKYYENEDLILGAANIIEGVPPLILGISKTGIGLTLMCTGGGLVPGIALTSMGVIEMSYGAFSVLEGSGSFISRYTDEENLFGNPMSTGGITPPF